MTFSGLFRASALLLALGVMLPSVVRAGDEDADPTAAAAETDKSDSDAKKSSSAEESKPKPKYPPAAEVLKDFDKIDGVIKLYRKDSKLYAELTSSQFNRDFLVLISIARGIGEGQLLGGMTWGFGDDWLWQFRKADDVVHIVRRNVRFRAAKGSPEEKAVDLAYTDSVLFALPIITTTSGGGVIVDLSPVFMTDLPQISQVLSGFAFSPSKSSWALVKGFDDNVELEVAATYASSGQANFDTVADSRGVSINIHYSISLLPETGYQPRLADDRVGHFLTVIKDYSKKGDDDRFVRYINRWDLQKADPSADMSPPKKPIVFWIENTVPYEYRGTIREGILEWNKAFEQAGISNAIEVRQQPEKADWEPEDVNYNTFRWITSSAGFAMGPSRVNPKTGQILDADIIFDADFVQFWKREYETFTPETVAAMTGGPLDLESYEAAQHKVPLMHRESHQCRCELHHGMSRELALGAAALMAKGDAKLSEKEQKKLIMQGLKEVVMHEVGHTLGLRHNFKGSTFRSLKELNNPKEAEGQLTSSVMDYTPVNMMPKGEQQGDYYSTTIGPYDMWAIEYAYTPLSSSTSGDVEKLREIASRGGEEGHDFATDEDTRGIDSDPFTNRFDLGKDPLDYVRARTKLTSELMPDVVERAGREGEGYQRVRQAFGVLLGNYGQSAFLAARFVGGVEVNRDHIGDPDARVPYVIVSAKQQREALKLISELLFADEPFDFSPDMLNHMAATHWSHWGLTYPPRSDYPVHEVIAMWQQRALDQMLSPLTLARLSDSQLKVAVDADVFSPAELFSSLTDDIFSELGNLKPGKKNDRNQAISSVRRNLQRLYVRRLSNIVLGMPGVPDDCQTLAYAELSDLYDQIEGLGDKLTKVDPVTRAHLKETSARIGKVLDANLALPKP